MSAQSADGTIAKMIGHAISAALGVVVTWLTAGSAGIGSGLVALLSILGGLSGPICFLIYRRYVGVLAAGTRPKGSPARQAYDSLRDSLSGGNIAARLYANRLTSFLNAVDRFFGDAGMADRTLFPRAFGLQTPAPLWTAPAFDRCLLLALIYPIATIFIIWAVAGHVGPAEAAILLQPGLSGLRRGLIVITVALSVLTAALAVHAPRRSTAIVWLGAYMFANLGSLLLGAVGVCLIGLSSLLVLGFFVAAGAKPIAVARAFGVVSVVGLIASTIAIGVAGALSNAAVDGAALFFVNFISFCGATVFTFLLVGATNRLCRFAIESRQQAALLLPIFPVMIIICLGAAGTLSSLTSWRLVGPLLLFLGLLTLINAPFDWASLGVTRALLRRGLELGGWWPYLLAIADALLATVIIATLALAMVIGVQAFDGLAIRGGGTPILLLDPFFDGIMAHPTLPEYWWVYALLLSTVIPSLVNLVIGGASLLRGVPGLPSLLLCFMPAGKAVPDFERRWIALVLTLQIVVGAILGVAAQAFLIIVVIGYVMPWFGLGLLDMARDLAAFNLPLRVSQLLGGG